MGRAYDPLWGLRNSGQAMEAAPDRFRFILERPIVDEPGVTWTYCGGATVLLGRMIAKGTRASCWLMPAAFSSIPWTSVLRYGGTAATEKLTAPRAYASCRATC